MSALIDVDELAAVLDDVTVLDVRWRLGRADGREEYLAGHVPTAVYVDLATELSDPPTVPPDERGRHPLPDPARFAAAMRRCGVSRDRPVVVYDDWSGMAAARAWWLLRDHRHPDVRLLDGGWSAWRDSGRDVETGWVETSDGDLTADPGHLPVVDGDGAARVAAAGVLLDARSAERYRGEEEPVDPVAGHVPGAVSVPATDTVVGGRLRPVEELRARFAGTEGREVAAYCGSGVTAAHTVLALHELGRAAALYPGSWSGWTADPGRPVARTDG